jgi:hypothetical protein
VGLFTSLSRKTLIQSNIIKGKIQHDKTFAVAAATANQFNLCNIAKLKQDYRVAKKRGKRGRELTIKIPSKLPGRDQLVYNNTLKPKTLVLHLFLNG